MAQKVLHIGIMPYQDYKTRSLAIARGEYRPRPDEPKIWFESMQSMAQVLSNENQLLLKTILAGCVNFDGSVGAWANGAGFALFIT